MPLLTRYPGDPLRFDKPMESRGENVATTRTRKTMAARHACVIAASVPLLALTLGCTPTVKVEAPTEPITINLNIKLDADVRVRLEEVAKEDVSTNPIF